MKMSLQEERSQVIRENIPNLITAITGLEDGKEEHKNCVDLAFSTIHNYRGLSTNSHEVRRRIEGIQEKFRVDNCGEYAEYFKELCDELVNHVYFKDCDIDVAWSILQFLLDLAHKPSIVLRRNKEKIEIQPVEPETEEIVDHELELLKKELKCDNFDLDFVESIDSDLSDWSDDSTKEEEKAASENNESEVTIETEQLETSAYLGISGLKHLKPPERQNPWREFSIDSQQSLSALHQLIQSGWWLKSNRTCKTEVPSRFFESNFAVIYARYLDDISRNYVIIPEPSTISEDNLIREIIWTFFFKKSCKVFDVNKNTISVRENVTIPSVSVNCFGYVLEYEIIPYMQMFHSLMSFVDMIEVGEKIVPTKTLQCYGYNLQLLIQSIKHVIIECERRMIDEKHLICPTTLISVLTELREALQAISILYEINKAVIIDSNKCPNHISSAFILTSLLNYSNHTLGSLQTNISLALFLTSIRAFFKFMDIWWTEGHFADWKEEFIVRYENGVGYVAREYEKNKEKSIFVPEKYSGIINNDNIFKLLMQYSLEAGIALNLLYEVNRMDALRTAFSSIKKNMYNEFIDAVINAIRAFEQTHGRLSDEVDSVVATQSGSVKQEFSAATHKQNAIDTKSNTLLTSDPFLKFAFTSDGDNSSDDENDTYAAKGQDVVDMGNDFFNINYLIHHFNQCSSLLPLQHIIHDALDKILSNRIDIANSFVMQLYKEEFMILTHLRNIRRVFLLEANDLMQQFYHKLFNEIESMDAWANSILLTSQLEDIISHKYPSMTSMFSFEIRSQAACKKDKVYEVVDELLLSYNRNREIGYVITDQDIADYNKIFCILLKVKWGVITLENLKFPRNHKKRSPYAPLTMTDIIMRRLEQLRFWMIYSMQSIHFHLMTQVLQSLGEQLEQKIVKCKNLKEMQELHKCYLKTLANHCFLKDNDSPLRLGLDQLLQLIFIVRVEWNDCLQRIDDEHPLSVDVTDDSFGEENYHQMVNSQMDTIESTYIRCHQYMANKLNTEVFLNRRNFLSGLSAAFNTSVPY